MAAEDATSLAAARPASSVAPLFVAWAGVSLAMAAHAWNAPGYDLSALVVGGRVVETSGFGPLYEHDSVAFNLAKGPAFAAAARDVGFGGVPTPFVHAPLLAWLAQPLAHVPFVTVMRGWTALSSLALFALFATLWWTYLNEPAMRARDSLVWGAVFLVGGLLFEPLRYSFWLGQTTVWIALLVAVALRTAGTRPRIAGASLAIAAFVKLTPIVLLLPWVIARKQRAVAWCVAFIAALSVASMIVAGVGPNVEYAGRVRAIGETTLVAFNNHSLSAFVRRLTLPKIEVWRWTLFPTTPWVHALVLGAAVAVALVAYRSARAFPAPLREQLLSGLSVLVILTVPSIVWTHYFVLLLIPLSIAWRLAAADSRARTVRSLVFVALALLVRPFLLDQEAPGADSTGVLWTPTLSVLVTLGAFLVLARHQRRQPRAHDSPFGVES